MTSILVILTRLTNWKQQYKDTLATLSFQIYKYFELNIIAIFNEPVTITKLVNKLALEKVEISQA